MGELQQPGVAVEEGGGLRAVTDVCRIDLELEEE
jgi:hypothetical protein